MQHDLEDSMPIESQKDWYTIKDKTVHLSKEYLLEAIDRQGLRRRRKALPTVCLLTVMIGDSLLLVSLLTLVLLLAPSLHLKILVSRDAFSKWDEKFVWTCLALLFWGFAIKITQAQNLSYVSSRFKSPLYALFALLLMLIFWLVLSYPFVEAEFMVRAWVGLLFLALATPVFITWRILLAEIFSLPRFRRRAVIVGNNTVGETLAKELWRSERLAINPLGYISQGIEERAQQDGLPILGGRSALRRLWQSGAIDMIIMAHDYKTNPELFQEAIEASTFGISVVPMAAVYESTCGKIPVEYAGDQWYLALPSERTISPLYLFWHTVMNLVSGICGLLVLSLVLPLIALLIYLDSPGPIFYSQERLGFQGRPFRIYKFRSMRTDAEQAGCPVWASEHDTRVTKIGRFLRTTHLDELPQTFNIMRGDMSLIGPRPERAEFVTELEKSFPFFRCRLAVKPGLTGWAQVKYHYSYTSNEALVKLQYDLYYIKHQSFLLDVYILLKTVVEVMLCHGT